MLSFELKSLAGVVLFDSAYAKTDYETKEQKTDATGTPLWIVNCLVREPEARRTENVAITVPLQKNPEELLQPLQPVAFDGLSILTGEMNGKPFCSLRASQIGQLK